MKHIGAIAKLGIPLMLGSVLQLFMNTMDMYFVSRLGTAYAAASSMGTSIAGVIFVFSMLVSTGTLALVARSKGQKNEIAIRNYAASGLILAFFIGLFLSGVTVVFSKEIIGVYKPELFIGSLIDDYLNIIFMFTFVVFLNSVLRNIIQATGDTKGPLYIFGSANIMNIILDYLFIMKLNYGIRGAAVATVLSQCFACVLMVVLLVKRNFDHEWIQLIRALTFRVEEWVSILKIGIWSCLQSIARPITGLIMMRIIYQVGHDNGSAAFGIGMTIVNYFFIILLGLSGAVTILIGHKHGENNLEEAKNIVNEGILIGFINYALFFLPFVILAPQLFGLFNTSIEVSRIGVAYLRTMYVSFFVLGHTFMYRGAFSGVGKTFYPMVSALIANIFVKIGLTLLFVYVFHLNMTGVGWQLLLL